MFFLASRSCSVLVLVSQAFAHSDNIIIIVYYFVGAWCETTQFEFHAISLRAER